MKSRGFDEKHFEIANRILLSYQVTQKSAVAFGVIEFGYSLREQTMLGCIETC
jgi:hypothetical protein